MTGLIESYTHVPSALAFMLRVARPRAGRGVPPPIVVRWQGARIAPRRLATYRAAIGRPDEGEISVLYPHVLGFPLHMALLTHRAYPLPIWRALQIRNVLRRLRTIDPTARFDVETRVAAHRPVEKGLEVDLETRFASGGECVWESTTTYFYRGRFEGAPMDAEAAPPVAMDPAAESFALPAHGGFGFARLTGDFNGLHWAKPYARRFGYRTAFLHPQRAAGLCMARLRAPASVAQQLRLWIKGPMFYGAKVRMHRAGAACFGLSVGDDPRMALVGEWSGLP